MEYDTASELYYAGSQYYNPQLTRAVSMMGPTSTSGTGGNPSGPGDLAGMGGSGGGGAFDVGQNAANGGIAMGAGLGAAGVTAGVSTLISTLGTEAGLSFSLGPAAPVGIVVGGLVDLGLFLDDLFGGGSPTVPWKLRHPAHGLTGLILAGQTDQVNQAETQEGSPCAGLTVPVLPDGSTVAANIQEAQLHAGASWVKPGAWWINKVRPFGAWDYKRYPGGWRKWDNAGNFNYGATGRAMGLDDQDLLSTAARLQMLNGTWQGGANSKADEIRAGERYYDCGCYH
ncbi:MAG: polymorphic toxin type 44 domain-containing protein [Candidatus Binataceae bacterium]